MEKKEIFKIVKNIEIFVFSLIETDRPKMSLLKSLMKM